uniref:Prolyl 4-hydroxylase alpha subunit domain-containing protein n=1 Tax=Acrobeloides nanus TaxID=290746 RepID=A0A914CW86_9BILA
MRAIDSSHRQTPYIGLFGSEYREADLLLPHDDRLEERKFAFIFYLSPDWSEEFGGSLNLYDHIPEENRPSQIAKSLVPKANNFVFFQVQANSWHSVSEVICKDKSRLSLNGWFHADNTPLAPEPKPEAGLPRIRPSLDITLADVYETISQNYTRPDEQKRIKRKFAAQSELVLQNFLSPEKYQAVLEELKSAPFDPIGPTDKRNVGRLDESKLGDNSALKLLISLIQSEALTLLLTQWTGLKLYDVKKHRNSEPAQKRIKLGENHGENSHSGGVGNSSSSRDVELVYFLDRYEHGSYSLADDQLAADAANNGFCLDLLLFFSDDEKWPEDAGGFISYAGVNEPNEILRVSPTKNSAAIVFREPEVLHFTKYVNLRAGSRRFYVLNCSFFGISNEDSESEDSLEDEDELSDGLCAEFDDSEIDDELVPEDEEGLVPDEEP